MAAKELDESLIISLLTKATKESKNDNIDVLETDAITVLENYLEAFLQINQDNALTLIRLMLK